MISRRAVVVAAILLVGCSRRGDAPAPVLPPLDGMEPAVAEKISTAHARVVADPTGANWAHYGRSLHAHGFAREAIEPYVAARDRSEMPEKFKVAYLAGLCALRPDPERAIELLSAAGKLRDDYIPLHLRLGAAYESLERWDDAGSAYARADSLSARERKPFSDALAGLGRVRLAQGRVAEAVTVLERARHLDPENADVHAVLAAAYGRSGRNDDALRETAIAGNLQDRHGFPDAIASEMRQEGVSYKALDLLGSSALLGGSYEKALAAFERALAARPDDPEAMLNKVQALCVLNRHSEAEPLCDRALGIRPDIPIGLALKGTCALVRADHQVAIAYLERALSFDPRNVTVRWNLARSLRALSRFEEAKQQLRTILDHRPHRSDVRLDLAAVLEQEGRVPEALSELENVLSRDPENRDASARRARLVR